MITYLAPYIRSVHISKKVWGVSSIEHDIGQDIKTTVEAAHRLCYADAARGCLSKPWCSELLIEVSICVTNSLCQIKRQKRGEGPPVLRHRSQHRSSKVLTARLTRMAVRMKSRLWSTVASVAQRASQHLRLDSRGQCLHLGNGGNGPERDARNNHMHLHARASAVTCCWQPAASSPFFLCSLITILILARRSPHDSRGA